MARKVLLGQTKGYRNHPQLIRFRATVDPVAAIDVFLSVILAEAQERGYNYDATKINLNSCSRRITVRQGQLAYEIEHLKKKLQIRDKSIYERILSAKTIDPNPLFTIVDGGIEDWEIQY